MRYTSGCLLCGAELVYLPQHEPQTCLYCAKQVESNARCAAGHFVCDACHSAGADDLTEQFCAQTTLSDPVDMAVTLMSHPSFAMHGPEHHFLVPAVLLAAYASQRTGVNLPALLRQARKRAEGVRGGSCGMCGNCGAGVGVGIFTSLATGATPLSGREWQLSNRATAETLLVIAEHGGPRCCKRDTFLALQTTRRFARQYLDLTLPEHEPIVCKFFRLNPECLRQNCPFYPDSKISAADGRSLE